MSLNESLNLSIETGLSKLNFFLVSTQTCQKLNPIAYCKYSSSLITIGHICLSFFFPVMLYQMRKLKKHFRNKYNLSFLWICSMILIFSIDLLEFLITKDRNLYSMIIISTTLFNIILGFIFAYQFIQIYLKDGIVYNQLLIAGFSFSLFVIIFFARLFTKNSLLKITQYDQKTYTKVNTHLFLYYFVYALFGFAQVKFLIIFFIFFLNLIQGKSKHSKEFCAHYDQSILFPMVNRFFFFKFLLVCFTNGPSI